MQFVTLANPATQVMKARGAGPILQTVTASTASGGLGFSGQQARLSDLVQEFPIIANPVTDFLASDVDDSFAVGRLKNALEFAGLDVAVMLPFVKTLRQTRGQARNARKPTRLCARSTIGSSWATAIAAPLKPDSPPVSLRCPLDLWAFCTPALKRGLPSNLNQMGELSSPSEAAMTADRTISLLIVPPVSQPRQGSTASPEFRDNLRPRAVPCTPRNTPLSSIALIAP